jgi:hypothetical protein
MADQTRIADDCGQSSSGERDSPDARPEADDEQGLTRREMIKLAAGAVVAAPLVGLGDARAAIAPQATAEKAVVNKAPLFFTAEEFLLVDELSELIIPTDDHSPGARAAGVAAYIDARLAESFEEEPKQLWRAGLKTIDSLSQEMHGHAFMKAAPQQRIALLTRISQNEMKPAKPEELFFRELKARTVRAYYTSKIGIKTEMEYKGNSYLKEFVGYEGT